MNMNFIENVFGNELQVRCPTCKNSHTHHVGVESAERFEEDAEFGTVVTVRGHHVSFSNDAGKRSVSRRRGSVSIRMSCEQGCDDFLISFVQHKGTTYINCNVLTEAGNTYWRGVDNAP
jgi:hypothetical protein